MNRFNADKDLFNTTDFKDVADIRSWLALKNSNCVWSIADGGAGLNSTARSHGDFDNDEVTLLSIEHVISNGY
jgi:protein involved in sex pheromone biosynthesis